MGCIDDIARCFGNGTLVKSQETFRAGSWRFSFSPWKLPTLDVFTCRSEDTLRIAASVDGSTKITATSSNPQSIQTFVDDLRTYHELEGGANTLELDIEISKQLLAGRISLYRLADFEKEVVRLNNRQALAAFELVCSGEHRWTFILSDESTEFETETFLFSRTSETSAPLIRDAVVNARKDVCHFEGNQRPFLPEDFRLLKRSSFEHLNTVFDRLCLTTVLVFICDVSSMNDDGSFSYKLNGYKALTGAIGQESVSVELLPELYKIYKWAYGGGNLADKLGIARNIISLHWSGNPSHAPQAGMFESILSGFAIYLKESVAEYIGLKKDLCDSLAETSQKFSQVAESVGDKLEKNFLAFAGFFISTVLLKAATEKTFPGFLPDHLRRIAWALVSISLLHTIVTLWFSLRERRKIVVDFSLLRNRYSDLLHESDLDRVLNSDVGLTKNLTHLDFKLRLFFAAWLVMLVICGVLIVKLSAAGSPSGKTGGASTNAPAGGGTQEQAERIANQFAANSGRREVRIHRSDGPIRDSDTVAPAKNPYQPADPEITPAAWAKVQRKIVREFGIDQEVLAAKRRDRRSARRFIALSN